ncbi:MAG: hypothetical protein WCD57_26310 [Acidobacteriaceae bacterium]
MSSTAYALPPQIETGGVRDTSSPFEFRATLDETPVPALIPIHGSAEILDKISLGTLFDARFRVQRPIPVMLDRSGEGVSAIWQEIDEFGHADSASVATVELARTLVELYSTLEREQMNLGADLERVWASLKEHIEHVRR